MLCIYVLRLIVLFHLQVVTVYRAAVRGSPEMAQHAINDFVLLPHRKTCRYGSLYKPEKMVLEPNGEMNNNDENEKMHLYDADKYLTLSCEKI